jgi:hypothetical protein
MQRLKYTIEFDNSYILEYHLVTRIMKHEKTSMQRSKVMAMVIVVAVATILVTLTATQALATSSLNSSKSNIYRQETHQNQSIEGGSGQQVSSNTCICTSNDIIAISGSD